MPSAPSKTLEIYALITHVSTTGLLSRCNLHLTEWVHTLCLLYWHRDASLRRLHSLLLLLRSKLLRRHGHAVFRQCLQLALWS